jgi:protoheme IX farnesyltransferase
MNKLRILAELTKLPISVASTLSAATGYVVFSHRLGIGILSAALGVLLTAMGACAWNELQDRNIDAAMERTRRRPIPAGVISARSAFFLGALLVAAGGTVLWILHGATAAGIALFAVAWYNGIYTYLKRVWAFAVVPGALIGALPPAIGWVAAGGNPLDPRVWALAFFFFIWQVPHFWLLLYIFGSEYSRAGLPTLVQLFGTRRLARLVFIWISATSASSLLLPAYGLTSSAWTALCLVATAAWLGWQGGRLLWGLQASFLATFRSINLYALCVMTLLIVDAVTG